ncbi:DUF3363 domain-containing protein, partial [Alphaproteobacteria bacterium]|nr:DUF3363 domain-containing protein [Alphaproteobacteria bacterium]
PHIGKKEPDVYLVSPKSLEQQINVEARTFMDLELWRQQKGYDLSIENFDKQSKQDFEKRKEWLLDKGYAYENRAGDFVMHGSAIQDLKQKELDRVGKWIAAELKKPYVELQKEGIQRVEYRKSLELHCGQYAAVEQEGKIALIKHPKESLIVGTILDVEFKEGKQQSVQSKSIHDLGEERAKEEGGRYIILEAKNSGGSAEYKENMEYQGKQYVMIGSLKGPEMTFVEVEKIEPMLPGKKVLVEPQPSGKVQIKGLEREREIERDEGMER